MRFQRFIRVVLLCAVATLVPRLGVAITPAWVAPIGIPVPSFGTAESAPALPATWSAAVSSYYFVCPTCSGATDSSNPSGYPAKPRATIPATVSGPAVVVLDGTISAGVSFTASGTATSPVFVTSYRPSTPAKLTGAVQPRGFYLILENLWIGPSSATANDFGFTLSEGAHHIALRNSELTGNKNGSGGIVLGSWGYNGSASVSNIVIDNNYIHNIGDVTASVDQDAHCVTVNGSDDNIWVTYNRLEYCSGDAMQVEAQSGRRAFIHHVYYGKNVAHHNRQSGGWVKNATDVVFSQNIAHDFRSNSGGPGACYGFQYDAEYVWFLFNDASMCNIGIAISGADNNPGQYAFIIGNTIHDTQSQNATNPYDAGAMVLRGSTNVYVVNNTMFNVDAGVNMPPGTKAVFYYNNIIFNRTNSSTYDLYTEGSVTLDVKNNLFGTNARFSGASAGTASKSGDPLFVAATAADFHVRAGSPAIDAGIASTVYSTYLTRYGVNISKDAGGSARPVGNAWDLGAFEFGGSVITAPAPPTNLRIIR